MPKIIDDLTKKRIQMVIELDLEQVHGLFSNFKEVQGLRTLAESVKLMGKILSLHGTESEVFKEYVVNLLENVVPKYRLKAIIEVMQIEEFNIKELTFSEWQRAQDEKIKQYKKNNISSYIERVFINEQLAVIVYGENLKRVHYEVDLKSIRSNSDVTNLIKRLQSFEWCSKMMIYELISKLKSNAYLHFIADKKEFVVKDAS